MSCGATALSFQRMLRQVVSEYVELFSTGAGTYFSNVIDSGLKINKEII